MTSAGSRRRTPPKVATAAHRIGDRRLGDQYRDGAAVARGTAPPLPPSRALAFLAAIEAATGPLLAPQVGDLYDRQSRERAVAFPIYGAAVNLGAFFALLITGAVFGLAFRRRLFEGGAHGPWVPALRFAAAGMTPPEGWEGWFSPEGA